MKSTIEIEVGFADNTSRKTQIEPLAPEAATPSAIRTRVQTFRTNLPQIASLYLSDSGASATSVVGASIISVDETVVI